MVIYSQTTLRKIQKFIVIQLGNKKGAPVEAPINI